MKLETFFLVLWVSCFEKNPNDRAWYSFRHSVRRVSHSLIPSSHVNADEAIRHWFKRYETRAYYRRQNQIADADKKLNEEVT